MWSDEEIDGAFRRLGQSEPAPEPFPLDAWLRLETKLDKDVIEQQFRVRLWRFFAGEMAVVALVATVWLLWPASSVNPAGQAPALAALRTAQPAPAARPIPGAPAAAPALSAPGRVAAGAGSIQPMASGSIPAANYPIDETEAAASPANQAAHTSALSAAAATASHQPVGPAMVAANGTRRPLKKPVVVAFAAVPAHPGLLATTTDTRRPLTLTNRTAEKAAPAGSANRTPRRRHTTRLSQALAAPASSVRKTTRSARADHDAAPNGNARVYSGAGIDQAGQLPGAASNPASEPGNTSGTSVGTTPADKLSGSPAASTAAASAAGETTELTTLPIQSVALRTLPLAELPQPLAAVPVLPVVLPEVARRPRFYLGVLAAPDVSSVKMADVQRPTPNLGLLLEYRFLDRLRVSTGLLHSAKQYRARHADYDWSYYPNANLYDFEWVDATCTILDLPVNLRYDVLVQPRYQLFGSVGLSTLFMRREQYSFDYEYYRNTYHWEREYVNEHQHWFSVLNLSAGYERRLGSHWGLQAEPYLKLPLGGVGEGKVRLASAGLFLGLKYGF